MSRRKNATIARGALCGSNGDRLALLQRMRNHVEVSVDRILEGHVIMSTITTRRATIDDLYRTEGKAELIGGRIVQTASGVLPSRVALNICIELRAFTKAAK